MKIWRHATTDVPTRALQGGELRSYYLADTFEMIVTDVPPGHTQPLHRHHHTVEVYFVLEGEIEIVVGPDRTRLRQGDAALLEPSGSFHTISNPTRVAARTMTLKLPHLASFRALFKMDKEMADDAPPNRDPS